MNGEVEKVLSYLKVKHSPRNAYQLGIKLVLFILWNNCW